MQFKIVFAFFIVTSQCLLSCKYYYYLIGYPPSYTSGFDFCFLTNPNPTNVAFVSDKFYSFICASFFQIIEIVPNFVSILRQFSHTFWISYRFGKHFLFYFIQIIKKKTLTQEDLALKFMAVTQYFFSLIKKYL